MSLDLPLDSLTFKLASEIETDEFVGTIVDINIKKDRYGRQMVQLVVDTLEPRVGRVVIALSPSYTNILVDNLKKMGFERLKDILGLTFKFKKYQLPKARKEYTNPYPRFIPYQLVK